MFVSPQIRSHCSDAPRSYLGWYMDTLNLCAGRRPKCVTAASPCSSAWEQELDKTASPCTENLLYFFKKSHSSEVSLLSETE